MTAAGEVASYAKWKDASALATTSCRWRYGAPFAAEDGEPLDVRSRFLHDEPDPDQDAERHATLRRAALQYLDFITQAELLASAVADLAQ